jgi:excisionase family DNA binding protein
MTEHINEQEQPLTVSEFARIYRASPQTIRNWIRRGVIPALQIGHLVRIPRAAAIASLQAYNQARARTEEPVSS